jgi:hypothetical protein
MINPERYTDGYRRPSLKVVFQPTASVAAAILASAELGLGEDISKLTKAGAEKVIRDGLRREGMEHWYFVHEECDEEEWKEIYDRACVAIGGWWPTWNLSPED